MFNRLHILFILCYNIKRDTITIRNTGDKNRKLDFNNVDWFINLQIDYEYCEEPVRSNLNKFLKLHRRNISLEYSP
jgi:hypothetical protein